MPGTVQAENYDTGGQGVAYNVTSVNGTGNGYRADGVDLEATSDTGGGYDLGWTASGQWFRYTVNVAIRRDLHGQPPGRRTLRGHRRLPPGQRVRRQPERDVNIPATGGWQTWTTVTATVTLPAGQQTLTLDQDNGGWNINYMSFAGTAGGTTNLALNRPVTASGYTQNYVPANAVDGKPHLLGEHRQRLPPVAPGRPRLGDQREQDRA